MALNEGLPFVDKEKALAFMIFGQHVASAGKGRHPGNRGEPVDRLGMPIPAELVLAQERHMMREGQHGGGAEPVHDFLLKNLARHAQGNHGTPRRKAPPERVRLDQFLGADKIALDGLPCLLRTPL